MSLFDPASVADALRSKGNAPLFREAVRCLEAARSQGPPVLDDVDALAGLIDHTQLTPEATEAQIRTLCREACRHRFASVCVSPSFVPLAADLLREESPKVCAVVGFPLGNTLPGVKAYEAEAATEAGADEVDMVLALGRLKGEQYDAVREDIAAVVEGAGRALVKVILETALLDDTEKVLACVIAQEAGADFVKTSTGFSSGGATRRDVALMRQVVGNRLGVKASGGVRSYEKARAMVEVGATRIGASRSVAIVEGTEEREKGERDEG